MLYGFLLYVEYQSSEIHVMLTYAYITKFSITKFFKIMVILLGGIQPQKIHMACAHYYDPIGIFLIILIEISFF